MVQILDQEPGTEKPDARVILDDGVANLEAEHSTLENPERVKANLAKAREQGRTCLFAVEEGNEERLEAILEDEDGDYRIISITAIGGVWYDE